jgi:amino acid adenylation domain-containing protein
MTTNIDSSNLTTSQFLIWIGQKLNPDVPLYNEPFAFFIKGKLEPELFRAAWQSLVNRSDTLRTMINEQNGVPHQCVLETVPCNLEIVDFSRDPDVNISLQSWLKKRSALLFDLKERLFDSVLIKRAGDEYVWYINQHHVITDGWSIGILYKRMAEFYQLALKDRLADAPELPSYKEYQVYESTFQKSSEYRKALTYWQGKNDAPSVPLDLYGSILSTQTTRSERVSFDIGRERSDKLRALSQDRDFRSFSIHISLFNFFSALLFSYLYRISGNSRLLIGTPSHNRPTAAYQKTMGLFSELFPLGVNITPGETFRSLIKAITKETHDILRYAQPGTSNAVPISNYSVVLNYVNVSFPAFCGMPMHSVWVHPGHGDMGHALRLHVHDFNASGSFQLQFDFSCTVFDHTLREKTVGHFKHLIDALLEDPDQPVSELPMMTEAERHQLLVEWNDTSTDYPGDKCIHELFEAQAERTPDTIAAIYGEQRLTYGELNGRANQLAHYLKRQGVGPEVFAGLCMERSLEMVIGILAILKAGGVYVPLDPEYPKERLAYMLEDTGITVILTQESIVDVLPEYDGIIICLDSDSKLIEGETRENPVSDVTSNNLAYVMYTSGSTGTPKGVSVSHRAVIRLIANTNYVKLERSDTVAQASTFSFDASTFEIWGALLNGACLVLILKDVILSPENFASQIRKHKISVLFLTTAMFNQMAREVPDAFRLLRYLLFGSEACDPACARMVLEAGPPANLLHVYGPTESTTFATWHKVEHVPEKAVTIPIGKPISNTTTYILDSSLQPVTVGVVGDLYIGGDGLAREYLNQPELTTGKFIADSINKEPGARLYRTGDLARYLPDGNIELLGRIDHQVKVRGFRIELGEIEAVLGQHPDVRETVVIAREDQLSDRRLVAYVVLDMKSVVATSELRSFLKEKLPDYMVPSTFIKLDSLPLTPNGKVDRRALPAPDSERPAIEDAFVEPCTPIEILIAGIWRDVLGLDQVGIHDNFFELGGHSFLATQVMSRLENLKGDNFPVAILFQYPTIAGLAEYLSRRNGMPQSIDQNFYTLYPIQTSGTRAPFFWIHSQMITFLPKYLGQDQPLYAIIAQGVDGKRVRYKTLKEITAHYLRELRAVQPSGPYFLGGFCWGAKYAFEIARQLLGQGEDVGLLFVVEPALLPAHTNQTFIDKLYPRLRRHRWRLSRHTVSGKIKYVLKMPLRYLRLKRIVSELYLKTGRPMSPLRSVYYALDVIMQTYGDFDQKTYPKEIVLIQAETGNHPVDSDWSNLTEGGVKAHVAQGATHMDLLEEPGAGVWAAWLDMYLRKAQATYSGIKA